MANRFWVGGTASWNGTATGKWSTSSGGASGAAEPTAADDVLFDGPSGSGTTTVDTTTAKCRSLNFTGYTGTFTGDSLTNVEIGDGTVGNITFGSGMTLSFQGSFALKSTTGTNTITTNGIAFPANMTLDLNAAGTWQLADALSSSSQISLNVPSCTFDTNGKTVTTTALLMNSSGTFTFGASTINVTGSSGTIIDFSGGGAITASTSTINVTNAGNSNKTINFGSLGANNVTITGGGSGIIVNGANDNTFNVYTINPPKSVRFRSTKTQTFTSFVASGTSGNVITLDASTAGSAAILADTSGTNSVTYCSIKDSNAGGGATWNADQNSTNVSGNTGWTFATINAFSFTDQTGVTKNTVTTSNTVVLGGGFTNASASASAGVTFSINGGSYATTASGVNSGDTVTARITSSSSALTAVTGTVTIGSRTSGTWSVTTKADPVAGTLDPDYAVGGVLNAIGFF